MIDTICSFPIPLVMGTSALVGALANSVYSVFKKRRIEKNFVFDWQKILDTTWQSALTGAGVGMSMSCGYVSILASALVGIGIDKFCNRVKIINILEMVFTKR